MLRSSKAFAQLVTKALSRDVISRSSLANLFRLRVGNSTQSFAFIRTSAHINFQSKGMADTVPGPIQSAVTVKIKQELNPEHIDVINESYMHNVPKGTESHFKIIVVSEQFEGQPLLKRHKLVHSVLHEELDSGAIHALSVVAKTPAQWAKSQEVSKSPSCMGGSQN